MVNIDVYDAFEKQHRNRLIKAAQSSRNIHSKVKLDQHNKKDSKAIFAWLRIKVRPNPLRDEGKVKIKPA